MTDLGILNERASARYTATLLDETQTPIDGSALDSLTLTLYDGDSGAIVNSRDAQNVKNMNGVTISAGGLLVWTIAPADNAIVALADRTPRLERRVALFQAAWASSAKKATHEITWQVRNLNKVT